jgi:stress response protein SCP2
MKVSGSADIVMGLHWDPPGQAASAPDLDAICMLLDARGRMLEVIHPGHRQGSSGSVVHTGDAVTGASRWDDERIFVFLKAVPAAVSALSFTVVSASRDPLNGIRGAVCHLSDHVTDEEYVRVDLAVFGSQLTAPIVTLQRDGDAWQIVPSPHVGDTSGQHARVAPATLPETSVESSELRGTSRSAAAGRSPARRP